jgi:hypothetical protein
MRWGSWRRVKQPKRSETYKRNYTLKLRSESNRRPAEQSQPEAKLFDSSGSSSELQRSFEEMWKEFGRDPQHMSTRARIITDRAKR